MANLEHYLRISIVDSKHFSEEDLFTELATNEGCVLFECESLLKAGGVDFMDCPLQICLKIFVRRRLKDEAPMLYHMVLPLAVISKHFLQPPHEWETWVGLLPSNSSLDICAPGDMFAHAVINLLADKTSPKLRLKFRYHNPELHAHMALQKQSEEERRQQQNMVRQSYGQQRFLDLHKFAGFRKDKTDRGENLTQSSVESIPPDIVPQESVTSLSLGEEDTAQKEGASPENSPEEAPKSAVAVPEQAGLDEQNLAESLRFAMLGALSEGADGAFAQPQQLQAVRARFPQLWLICQDVSKMANDMAKLAEVAEVSGAQVQEENARLRAELEQSQLQLKKAEEEIARLKVFHGQSPEIDLL